MGFVYDAGNSGIAKAAEGLAAGIETSRQVQDQQQAREMAMTELQLRQQQTDLAMDQFSERLRVNQAKEARADLRIVSDLEHRKKSQSLSQQRFDAITARESREAEADRTRGEANAALLKAMGDSGGVSDEEYAMLEKTVSGMSPGLRAEVLFKAKGLRAAKDQRDLDRKVKNLAAQEKYILSSAGSPEEGVALQEEMIAAQVMFRDDPEGYAEAIGGMQEAILRSAVAREEIARWGPDSMAQIGASIKDVDERQEAYALRHQVLEIGAENPNDPRLSQYRKRVDWLATPKDVRKRTVAAERREREMAATMTAIGWGGAEQMERLTRVHLEQRAIGVALLGETFAKTEEERGRELVAGLKAAGMDVDLDVLLPADKALPQQLLYAFQSFDVANRAMGGASGPAINEHMKGLFERAGVIADESAAALYKEWRDDPSVLDVSKLDMDKLLDANIHKVEKRKDLPNAEKEAQKVRDQQWIRIFKYNQKMEKVGGKTIPQGPPPIGLEKIARSMGWDDGMSVLDRLKLDAQDFIEDEQNPGTLLEERGFGAVPEVMPIAPSANPFLSDGAGA